METVSEVDMMTKSPMISNDGRMIVLQCSKMTLSKYGSSSSHHLVDLKSLSCDIAPFLPG
jgi:hypothetical protein